MLAEREREREREREYVLQTANDVWREQARHHVSVDEPSPAHRALCYRLYIIFAAGPPVGGHQGAVVVG